ncbi:glycosyltransferase family 4 protein [Vibrio metschnikovii]|uniref:glycosyltransferase family 4 protein n=1 Tax=Vibrio metschnikovii TaxID=28172 RepID=UPI001648AB4E|nr:glycosyltransferase family 4 protein [Vibrio metschnikovii]MBC3618017.1 glycosyltransferase family 4 protein [Vibrio metschnikovii]MBC5813951.1 glycosyltransferase family 4 protein [Vibrio metschnikovii]
MSSSNLNILVLTNMYPSENVQKGIFVSEQCNSIKRNFNSISIFVCNIDNYALFGFLKYFFAIFSLLKVLVFKRIDIIHVHYGLSFIPLFFLLPIVYLIKSKIVLTCHGSDLMGARLVNFFTNLGGKFSCKIILVSSEQVKYLWKCNLSKFIVVPCGVDSSFFYYNSNIKNQTADGKIKIIFPSNPSREEKNYKMFDSILNKINAHGRSVEVVIFKDMSREKVRDALFSSDYLLLTSLREGSPQVVKEAVFSGLPVISTQVGDVKEILEYSKQCLVSNDEDEIVNFILSHKKSFRLDRDFVSQVVSKYSDDIIATKLHNIYWALYEKN